MLYALIGVPLMLLCLSNLGALLADTFQFAYSQASCCCRSTPQPYKHPPHRYDSHHLQPSHCNRHRTPSYTSQKSITNQESTSTIVEINNTTVRSATVLSNGGRPRLPSQARMMRPMPSEVRNLLTECAEYTLAQDSSDRGSVKLLRQLKDPDSEDDKGDDNDEDRDDPDDLELGDIGHHSTPSRVPLIWHQNHENHISKRPPTPPPRRPRSDTSPHDVHRHTTTREPNVRVPISIVLFVLAGYICLGATVFSTWEEWDFLDGAYFCFITLSTIGFGDLVPGKSFNKAETEGGQLKIVACCAYLILGLVLIAMSFTLVQEEVLDKCRQIALTIGILKRRDPH